MIRMTIFQNKAEEELIWMLLLHTYKKKTSFRMKRQKPNHETLTFDEEDVKEEPQMIKKNKAFDEEEEKENKIYEMTKIVKSTLIENKIVK